jgi:hypothetical protein
VENFVDILAQVGLDEVVTSGVVVDVHLDIVNVAFKEYDLLSSLLVILEDL